MIGHVSSRHHRGEAIVIPLITDAAGVVAISGNLKRAAAGPSVPKDAAPVAAVFSISGRAPTGSLAGGYDFALTGSVTADLAPGVYCVNAVLDLGTGSPVISEPYFLKLEASTL